MAKTPKAIIDRNQITDSNRDIWRRKLGVSHEALAALIQKVGHSVEAVRAELKRQTEKA